MEGEREAMEGRREAIEGERRGNMRGEKKLRRGNSKRLDLSMDEESRKRERTILSK